METREGVEAEVDADMTDIGRDGRREPGEDVDVRSTG